MLPHIQHPFRSDQIVVSVIPRLAMARSLQKFPSIEEVVNNQKHQVQYVIWLLEFGQFIQEQLDRLRLKGIINLKKISRYVDLTAWIIVDPALKHKVPEDEYLIYQQMLEDLLLQLRLHLEAFMVAIKEANIPSVAEVVRRFPNLE